VGVRFAHVIFDLDGTLVDSSADLTAAVNHVLGRLGLPPLLRSTVCAYVGEGVRVLVQRALGPAHQARLDNAVKMFLAYYGAHLLDHTRAYPGIPETLEGLAARAVQLSLFTNKPVAFSRAILDGLGLLPRFRAVLGGDSLPAGKPDPGGVVFLQALTGCPLERTLLVGDSPIDLRTARAAGVAFCGAAWGLQPATLRAAAPERIIDAPADLLSVVAG
jgi:phosphoglycolate phosphatase